MNRDSKIVVVGLGYVGLPLAVSLARSYLVIGFDIDAGRVEELQAGEDRTREIEPEKKWTPGYYFTFYVLQYCHSILSSNLFGLVIFWALL